MNPLTQLIAVSLLSSLPATPIAGPRASIYLSIDPSTQTLQVHSLIEGTVFLALGPLSVPPIPIGGIYLDVVPDQVLLLGAVSAGDVTRLPVPRGMSHLHAEAVLFDAESSTLHDSNVVSLGDASVDLVAATFRAELISTDSIPPLYTVAASLTAPSGGYEFLVDGFQLEDGTTHVYLRLIEPGEDEIVIPVLTQHRQAVFLGGEVGEVVHVHLTRVPRGATGPEVYRLMAQLPVRRKS